MSELHTSQREPTCLACIKTSSDIHILCPRRYEGVERASIRVVAMSSFNLTQPPSRRQTHEKHPSECQSPCVWSTDGVTGFAYRSNAPPIATPPQNSVESPVHFALQVSGPPISLTGIVKLAHPEQHKTVSKTSIWRMTEQDVPHWLPFVKPATMNPWAAHPLTHPSGVVEFDSASAVKPTSLPKPLLGYEPIANMRDPDRYSYTGKQPRRVYPFRARGVAKLYREYELNPLRGDHPQISEASPGQAEVQFASLFGLGGAVALVQTLRRA